MLSTLTNLFGTTTLGASIGVAVAKHYGAALSYTHAADGSLALNMGPAAVKNAAIGAAVGLAADILGVPGWFECHSCHKVALSGEESTTSGNHGSNSW